MYTCLEKDPTSAKRQHVERSIGSPSDVARIPGWTEFTKKVRHVYCHRPRHGFPVTLQVRAFGEFVDALKIDAELRYRKMALDLMLAMAIVYPNERKRQKKLKSIFVQNGFSFSQVGTRAFQCDYKGQ